MDVTVNVPSIGTEAYFTFKQPFNFYIKNKFNINTLSIKMKVISIISMRDMIRTDLRDPFTEIYEVAGLSEVDYKRDLTDNVYLISFSFKTCDGVERYVRLPLNYISEISQASTVEYINRVLMLDLGELPKDLDLSPVYNDIMDYVATRIGVAPDIKNVAIGDVTLLDHFEHETRETVRENNVEVHKTLSVELEEITLRHDELLNRLNTLGIVLG